MAIDLLSDLEHSVLKAYGAWGKKKEYEGVIRSTVLIDPQGLTRRRWPKAKTKGHAAEVLVELEKIAG